MTGTLRSQRPPRLASPQARQSSSSARARRRAARARRDRAPRSGEPRRARRTRRRGAGARGTRASRARARRRGRRSACGDASPGRARRARCPLRRISDKRSAARTATVADERVRVARAGGCPRRARTRTSPRSGIRRARAGGCPSACGPSLAKTPIIADPSRPPRMTSATAMRFVALSMWSSISSMPGFSICTWNVPSRSCSSTSRDLVRHVPRDRARARAPRRGRAVTDDARVEAIGEQAARVRLRDLEDVEVRVDLLPDRGERRDRLVEHDEPAR